MNIADRIAELQRQGYGRIQRRTWGPLGYIKTGGKRRAKAHSAVWKARQLGLLVAGPCEVCGCAETVAHHDDYSRPLDVRWLCRNHHRAWHQKHGEAANP